MSKRISNNGAGATGGDDSAAAGGPTWSARVRDRIVRFGIRSVCGVAADVEQIEPSVAADVPLVSAGLRFLWLRTLERVGVESTVAKSAFGHRFVCHIGDCAEFPYYHRRALAPELALCSAWLRDEDNPVIFDVGANVGYFATQLSQILAARDPMIYAFEPVPGTFAKLVASIRKLDLRRSIHPIAAAAFDDMTVLDITCPNDNSLLSQVEQSKPNGRVTGVTSHVPALSLDAFCSKYKTRPALIKIDVEGSEVAALRGAKQIIEGSRPPAIALEFSPRMLAECGASVEGLIGLLHQYQFYYVDDIVGQKRAYGSIVESLLDIGWTCNLFAVPDTDNYAERCAAAFAYAEQSLDMGG